MSEVEEPDLPDVVVKKGRGLSLVWLVPVVAVVVGAWLGYDAWLNRGIEIVITYPTADWVEAGKTKIKFRSVDVGIVDEISFIDGDKGVELHGTLQRKGARYLTEDALFWIEHPRIGGGEVSGLGTLLSGAYIGMRLGDPTKKRRHRFEGLDQPPIAPLTDGGLRLTLRAEELYSVRTGTHVFYLQKSVGSVERYDIAEDGNGFVIHLLVDQKYAHLVRADSRFWNAGGIQLSASLGHLDVSTPSLASMLSGGVAFDAPRGNRSAAAKPGATFRLHGTRSDVEGYLFSHEGLRVIVEAKLLQGVSAGDPVSYRELTVGSVVSTRIATDARRIRVELNIMQKYASLVRHNSRFWNASGISADLGLTGLHVHAESLQSLLAGGVAFATPDPPGHTVKAGSVFKLHDELEEKWLKWDPVLWLGPAKESPQAKARAAAAKEKSPAKEDAAPAETAAKTDSEGEKGGFFSRFFHHDGKSEAEAEKDHHD